LRLISLWPFPEVLFNELSEKVDTIIVAEMNLGQMSREIQRATGHPVRGIFHAGGEMIPPEPILEAILETAP
jgi:2-oxoglutarate ferredoxin oxidoreductase subunit alpha